MRIGRGLEGKIGGTTLNATYAHAETPHWVRRGGSHPPRGATNPHFVKAVSLTESAPDGNNWRMRHPHVELG